MLVAILLLTASRVFSKSSKEIFLHVDDIRKCADHETEKKKGDYCPHFKVQTSVSKEENITKWQKKHVYFLR